jgi:prephenate dehydratase
MIRFGIQGCPGSFNEEAALLYLKQNNSIATIVYLFTTDAVFESLKKKEIDLGQFALLNGVGGIVDESIEAIAKNIFEVVDTVNLTITHHMMKRKDSKGITFLMAHPQVFKQCKQTLIKDYPDIKLLEGRGDLIDTARAARALSEKELEENIGILGPKELSKIYDLEIIASNLQDSEHNVTTFIVIK